MIAAMDQNRCIGGHNRLLWDIPEDLQHFRSMTRGKTLIMGRKTFDSIGRVLPERISIVVTRQENWSHEGVYAVNSLKTAFNKAIALGSDAVWVIGGAEIYAQALPFATKLYLTEIKGSYTGDAYFPDLPAAEWQEVERTPGKDSGTKGPAYEFVTYTRKLGR